MKKISALLLALLLCFACTAAFAADGEDVPRSTSELPGMPARPDAPQIVRVQREDGSMSITLDRTLPSESLVTLLAIGSDCRKADVNAATADGLTWTASGLPAGGQWIGAEIAWVSGGENAVARYNAVGGLEKITAFDRFFNEFVFNSSGRFYEFGSSVSDVRARFNANGDLTAYAYEAVRNAMVWFNLQGDVIEAAYDDGVFAASWEEGTGWYVNGVNGRIKVSLNVNVWGAKPLLTPEKEDEEEKEPEVVWYPNNTIGLAGLSLQEADPSLPNKWYNVVPINLTAEGRQTYFLVITNKLFVGKCYVDVYGDEVTVSYDLIGNSSLEYKSHYGRFFTELSDITAESIEANDNAIVFGEPMSISEDLGGADVALLFIRSKGTYRLPFKDGTELSEYWRNKPDWKQFRKDLLTLMPYVEK